MKMVRGCSAPTGSPRASSTSARRAAGPSPTSTATCTRSSTRSPRPASPRTSWSSARSTSPGTPSTTSGTTATSCPATRAVLFNQFVNVFKDMKHDYNTKQPPIALLRRRPVGPACDDSVDKYTTWIFPKTSSRTDDVVLDMLRQDPVPRPPTGTGGYTRTHLGCPCTRCGASGGDYLASAIREKWAEGCDFRVGYRADRLHTKQILGASTARGRIPLAVHRSRLPPGRRLRPQRRRRGRRDPRLLQRTRSTSSSRAPTTASPTPTWCSPARPTGPASAPPRTRCSSPSRVGPTRKRYLANFNSFWNNGRWSRNAYTTTYTDFRVARMERQADGCYKKVYVTVRASGDHGRARPGSRRWPVLGRRLRASTAVAVAGVLGGEQVLGQRDHGAWSGPTTTTEVPESALARAAAFMPV